MSTHVRSSIYVFVDMPQHQLPVLEVDGKTRIVQSLTIARFVARELSKYNLSNGINPFK